LGQVPQEARPAFQVAPLPRLGVQSASTGKASVAGPGRILGSLPSKARVDLVEGKIREQHAVFWLASVWARKARDCAEGAAHEGAQAVNSAAPLCGQEGACWALDLDRAYGALQDAALGLGRAPGPAGSLAEPLTCHFRNAAPSLLDVCWDSDPAQRLGRGPPGLPLSGGGVPRGGWRRRHAWPLQGGGTPRRRRADGPMRLRWAWVPAGASGWRSPGGSTARSSSFCRQGTCRRAGRCRGWPRRSWRIRGQRD